MSDFMADLSSLVSINGLSRSSSSDSLVKNGGAGKSQLDMTDYLTLMVSMFQNQSMDDTASVDDLMNNMVQMSVVEAITSLTSLIQESTALNYAASLVGKEVTVGETLNGKLIEHVGTVTGTGTLDGQQVIFLGDDCYFINSVMAVGRLPDSSKAVAEEEQQQQQSGVVVSNNVEDEEVLEAGAIGEAIST